MSDTSWTAVVVIFWTSIGTLVWAIILDGWHSRIPRRHFGSLNPSEEDVSQGLDKAKDTVKQCYVDLDAVRAQQIAAKELESIEEASRRFIHAKKALVCALKRRDQARGWAYSRGFDRAVARHIKNPATMAEETDALLEKPRSGFAKN